MGASESLADVPHRPRLASYPADRLPDLYGSLSALLGIRGVRTLTAIALALGLALVAGPSVADQNDPRLGELFARLEAAPDAHAAQDVERASRLVPADLRHRLSDRLLDRLLIR